MGDHGFHKVRGNGDIPCTFFSEGHPLHLITYCWLKFFHLIHICTLVTLIMLVTQTLYNGPYSQYLWTMELIFHLFHTLVGPSFLVHPLWEDISSHLWALFLVFRGSTIFSSFYSYTMHWWSYFCASMIFMTLLDALSHLFRPPWCFVTPFMH